MTEISFEQVKQDCIHFRGGIPCKPNKAHGAVCTTCDHYKPVSKRILIIKLGALGDVIRTTPLVVRFREEFGDCHITWLTLSPEVLPVDSINTILKPDAFALFHIRESAYDIAINLDKETEACQLLSAVNAKEKYGFAFDNNTIVPATPAATHKLMTGFFDELSQENTKSYLEEIFEICHRDFRMEPYLINKNESLATTWKARFGELAGEKMIIGLNTGCGPRWNTRLWPEENWRELANLLRAAGYFPVFLGGSLEHEKNTRMAQATGAYYPGHFSLEEFIALSDACSVILTQVSMMMHIATALRKRMVLMNNIFNKHEFELYGRGEIAGPSGGCECYYGNSCKRGTSCMHEITPEQIFNAIRRVAAKPA